MKRRNHKIRRISYSKNRKKRQNMLKKMQETLIRHYLLET